MSPCLQLDEVDGPRLLIASSSECNGMRTVAQLREAVKGGVAAKLWQTLLAEVEANQKSDPILPTTAVKFRSAHHVQSGNLDYILVNAAGQRIMMAALAWLVTGDVKFQRDAMRQSEVIFDDAQWPEWMDRAHSEQGYLVDLRTGQFMRALGFAYDWLKSGLPDADRRWFVEQLSRRAVQPFLEEVDRGTWFTGTKRINNWNTCIVGGAGIAAMGLGADLPDAERILAHAQRVMDVYIRELGPEGEFNESVGYAGAVRLPVEFFVTHYYYTRGADPWGRSALAQLQAFCKWYAYFILPPGRVARLGDCNPSMPPVAGVFPGVASTTRDGVLQWLYLNYARSGNQASLSTDVVLELLLYDDTLEPVSPEGSLPRARSFEAHGAVWSSRASWDPDTTPTVVYGKGGHGQELHGHHDAGQVCIDAWSREMIVDIGHPAPSYPKDYFEPTRWAYYNASAHGHNILTIGGRDQRCGSEFRAQLIDAEFIDEVGGYWLSDLTALYENVAMLRRLVVHLLPATVVVLDTADFDAQEDFNLRWHTANHSVPTDQGAFVVENDGVGMAAQMASLAGDIAFRPGRHVYEAPFNRSRYGDPLVQRNEPYVDAYGFGTGCQLVTLFHAFKPKAVVTQWEAVDDGWRLDTEDARVSVRLTDGCLVARNEVSGEHVSVHI